MLCWVPSHVGILGNEQADRAAKSAVVPISVGIPVRDLKKHVEMFLHTKWQEQWDLETDNKLHTLKPLVQPWPSLANRKKILLLLVCALDIPNLPIFTCCLERNHQCVRVATVGCQSAIFF
ncbi:hypothetical protein AVEN_98091-1 [Araneus ventricosus]|uniref:RNase H type-1 domain-containing protein n=1 Tax=Araneus ventricosus TaxID=182803 RepID=A0A4Y2M9E9_ARAVE|nr:hypothetical protein AVEN_98091-1 [Araneus ventricosus]